MFEQKQMEAYESVLRRVDLFRGILAKDLAGMLVCLSAEKIEYKKGAILLLAGDKPEHVGILLSGALLIVKEDYAGNRTIVDFLEPGGYFAEALCCAGVSESPVTVVAEADSKIMRINFSRILRTCPNSCVFHHQLIENMLGIIASRNIFLQNRMEITCSKSVREKVLRYLQAIPARQGNRITIPLNRQEMADYLCVERSALSHELMKMKKDGLIDYRNNVFTLYPQHIPPSFGPVSPKET